MTNTFLNLSKILPLNYQSPFHNGVWWVQCHILTLTSRSEITLIGLWYSMGIPISILCIVPSFIPLTGLRMRDILIYGQ